MKLGVIARTEVARGLVTRAVEQFLDRLIPVDEMRWTRD